MNAKRKRLMVWIVFWTIVGIAAAATSPIEKVTGWRLILEIGAQIMIGVCACVGIVAAPRK